MTTPLDQKRAEEMMKLFHSFSMLEQLEEDTENKLMDQIAVKLSEYRRMDAEAPLSLNDYRDMVELDQIQSDLGLDDLRPDKQ